MNRSNLRHMIRTNPRFLQREARSLHPATIAEILGELSLSENLKLLRTLPPLVMSDVFSHFDLSVQAELVELMSSRERAELITNMYHDDRVDLMKQIPKELSQDLLGEVSEKVRKDIQKLSAYKEKTAGALMTSEYLYVPDSMTAGQTIEYLRRVATEVETPYDIYIIDLQHKLIGSITLKDLILAPSEQQVKHFMVTDLIYAHATDSRESAARKISKYDIISLPVVDHDGVLVGIITYDDALDALDMEHTEDLEKLMAISGPHESEAYLATPVLRHFSNRVVWVVALAILGLISGFVLQRYENTLSSLVILALYMPMLMDTGGNTGSQSATIVIRSLATGDLDEKDIFKVLWTELRVSVLISVVIGLLSFTRVMFMSQHTVVPAGISLLNVALAIAIALSLQVISSTLLGALLPLLVAKAKFDPAVVASPAITTVVDITGLIIYFGVATAMLSL